MAFNAMAQVKHFAFEARSEIGCIGVRILVAAIFCVVVLVGELLVAEEGVHLGVVRDRVFLLALLCMSIVL